jgi:hypothetical protein
LRLRFDERELTLIKGAEHVRGVALAHTLRPDQLRTALSLARAGQKLGHAQPGSSVSLDETEVQLLFEALRYATDEVHLAARTDHNQDEERHQAVLAGFPELVERGVWRSFGLTRELETLAARLHAALTA